MERMPYWFGVWEPGFCGIMKLVAMVHGVSQFRVSRALSEFTPTNIRDVWNLLQSIGFNPYVVLGKDDFDEMLVHGGRLQRPGYAKFDPDALLASTSVSSHVKALVRELR